MPLSKIQAKAGRRLIAPEVVQSSAMDCGPAALKCLLEGHGIPVSYGRLREACQTDVDGTSIDTLEVVANQLGLEAEQIMVPADHLLLPEANALPALVVVRLPNGFTHFVVVWRHHGPLLQVMDPRAGRRWLTVDQFRDELFIHRFPVPAEGWRQWAGSDEFLDPLRRRLRNLGVAEEKDTGLIGLALADESWRALARLDAATRLGAALAAARALRGPQEIGRALERLVAGEAGKLIPDRYWSVRPEEEGADNPQRLILRGAVLIRIVGRQAAPEPDAPSLSPELAAAAAEPPPHALRELLHFLGAGGLSGWPALLLGGGLVAAGLVVEAVLFRALLGVGRLAGNAGPGPQILAIALLVSTMVLLLEFSFTAYGWRLGRRLEIRLRTAFREKLPRLHDRYFQSRLVSDMADRSHSVYLLRQAPNLGRRFLQVLFELLLTTAAIIWLAPALASIAVLAALAAASLPLAVHSLLAEQEMRARTHLGALARFYLDAMLGLVPVRTHGAERPIRQEHSSLLATWVEATLSRLRTVVTVEGVQQATSFLFVIWLLFAYAGRQGIDADLLLLAYWALNLTRIGQDITTLVRQYPRQRAVALRLMEPLAAPEADEGVASELPEAADPPSLPAAVALELERVSVRAGGHTILDDISLNIGAGEHVAIVGPSGAGKSTLVGLLLGWHRPATGYVCVDGHPLAGGRLAHLRAGTAWVDPGVQLWNRSLLENVYYGAGNGCQPSLAEIVERMELDRLLERLPNGLETALGEGGGLVSGGEGQRLRLARAMMRPEARLVILDEPFRGLDRGQRRRLLQRARCYWHQATLLCVTHDVAETQQFERVLVVEDGRIVEDGTPAQLAADPGSHYRALLEAEAGVRHDLWTGAGWRRWRMEDGVLYAGGERT